MYECFFMCVYLFLASFSFMAVFFLLINGSLFSRDQLHCITPSINWIEDTFYLNVCNALKSDMIQTLESVTNKFRFESPRSRTIITLICEVRGTWETF